MGHAGRHSRRAGHQHEPELHDLDIDGDITINGSPNTSKVVVIDGVNVIDELGTQAQVNPNIDAVGEVQVISSGYTAENGRSSGGLIIMTTKSGTNKLSGSTWYNARRKEWRANEYFREKNNQAKADYRVNIPGYSLGGPIIIPKVLDRGKAFFFVSQEFTDDLRPATFSRTNYPTALERQGDFSQTYFGNANGPGQGTLVQIINPDTGQPFPGNKIPASCAGITGCVNGYMHPLGQQMLNLLPMPNGYFDPANNQYNAFNYGVDTYPYHSRTNNTLRIDGVLNSSVRGSYRFIKDREDNISNNVFAPGIGWANNAVPGYISTGSFTQVLGRTWSTKPRSGSRTTATPGIPTTASITRTTASTTAGRRASIRLASNPSAHTATRRASGTTSRMSIRTFRQ